VIIGAIGISKELTIITSDKTHFNAIKTVNDKLNAEFW